jgi:hypothetical protein
MGTVSIRHFLTVPGPEVTGNTVRMGRKNSNPRVTVSWQILTVVQPKAEDVQNAWDARV